MYDMIAEHVSHCVVCQHSKDTIQPHPMRFSSIAPDAPNQVLGMDFIGPMNVGPYDEEYVLTIVDYYDNYVKYIPCRNTTGLLSF